MSITHILFVFKIKSSHMADAHLSFTKTLNVSLIVISTHHWLYSMTIRSKH